MVIVVAPEMSAPSASFHLVEVEKAKRVDEAVLQVSFVVLERLVAFDEVAGFQGVKRLRERLARDNARFLRDFFAAISALAFGKLSDDGLVRLGRPEQGVEQPCEFVFQVCLVVELQAVDGLGQTQSGLYITKVHRYAADGHVELENVVTRKGNIL